MTFLPKRPWVLQLLPEVTFSDSLFDSNRRAGGVLKERDTQETPEAASALIQHCPGQDKTEDKSYVTHSMSRHSLGIHQGKYSGQWTWWRSWQSVNVLNGPLPLPSTAMRGWLKLQLQNSRAQSHISEGKLSCISAFTSHWDYSYLWVGLKPHKDCDWDL